MMRSDMYSSPADDPETRGFVKTIAKSNDPLHMLEFSDWLQESGYQNAAHGMRFAAKYGKRPVQPGEQPFSGWVSSDRVAGDYIPHARLPNVIMHGHGNMAMSHYRREPEERVHQHWNDYLSATHNTNFDENSEPLSRYPAGHILHNTDLDHPKS